MRRLLPIVALSLLAGIGVHGGRSAAPGLQPGPGVDLASRAEPETESGAAQAFRFYRDKRLRYSGRIDPARAYAEARRHLDQLPRHSLATGPRQYGPAGAEPLAAWEALGPGNVGGRSRALVIHPTAPRIMYVAGVSGGVWKTTNNGNRWQPLDDEMANLSVNSLAMSPTDPKVLYAGTGEGYFREAVRGTALPLRGAGIFKTTDAGATWVRLASTSGNAFRWVNDLVVSHLDPQRVYAATRKGVYRSLDGGTTWTRTLATSVKGGCLDLEIRRAAPTDYLFASCGTLAPATVYRNAEANSGASWQQVLKEPGMGRASIAIAPSRPDTIYALAASNVPGTFEQGLHAVYRSDEAGAPGSWRVQLDNTSPDKLSTLMLSNPIIGFLEECGFTGSNSVFNMGWYTNTLAVDPADHETVWVGGVDLFRSDDGGRSFGAASYWWIDRANPSFAHADQHRIVFHPRYNGGSNRKMFILNDGGIYKTLNALAPVTSGIQGACGSVSGPRWIPLNHDYGVTQFYNGAVFPGGKRYLAGAQDNGTVSRRDSQGPNSWTRVLGGDGGYSVIDVDDPTFVYATVQGGRVFRSTAGANGSNGDFVESVTGIDDLLVDGGSGFRATVPHFLFIAPLVGDPNEGARLWLGGTRLWRTSNRADSWSAASPPLGAKTSAIAVAPGDSETVVAGTARGRIHRQTAATTAGGETVWESVRPRAGFISSLAFDPADTNVIYATYANFGGAHLWRSIDGGAHFAAIGHSGPERLPNIPVHSVIVDPTDSQRLFVGTDLGVLVSTDGGDTWAVENTGFANVVTESLVVAERNGRPHLYAFTHGRGAWRAALN